MSIAAAAAAAAVSGVDDTTCLILNFENNLDLGVCNLDVIRSKAAAGTDAADVTSICASTIALAFIFRGNRPSPSNLVSLDWYSSFALGVLGCFLFH